MLLVAFCFGIPAFAGSQAIELNVDLSLNGKHIMSPKILAKDGEKTTVTSGQGAERTYMEVIATERLLNNKKAVQMNFVIGTINAGGKKTVLSNSTLITRENNRGEIQTVEENGEAIVISAKPTMRTAQ